MRTPAARERGVFFGGRVLSCSAKDVHDLSRQGEAVTPHRALEGLGTRTVAVEAGGQRDCLAIYPRQLGAVFGVVGAKRAQVIGAVRGDPFERVRAFDLALGASLPVACSVVLMIRRVPSEEAKQHHDDDDEKGSGLLH